MDICHIRCKVIPKSENYFIAVAKDVLQNFKSAGFPQADQTKVIISIQSSQHYTWKDKEPYYIQYHLTRCDLDYKLSEIYHTITISLHQMQMFGQL